MVHIITRFQNLKYLEFLIIDLSSEKKNEKKSIFQVRSPFLRERKIRGLKVINSFIPIERVILFQIFLLIPTLRSIFFPFFSRFQFPFTFAIDKLALVDAGAEK